MSLASWRLLTGVRTLCLVWCGVVWCARGVPCGSSVRPVRSWCGACFPGSWHPVAVLLDTWSYAFVVAGGVPLRRAGPVPNAVSAL